MSEETPLIPPDAQAGLRHRLQVAKWLVGLWLVAGVTFIGCSVVNSAVGAYRVARNVGEANRNMATQQAATATAFAIERGAPPLPTATPAGLFPAIELPSLPGFGPTATPPLPATPVAAVILPTPDPVQELPGVPGEGDTIAPAGDAPVVVLPTMTPLAPPALPTQPTGNNPSMFATASPASARGNFRIVTQQPASTLRVVNAIQSDTQLFLAVEYIPADDRPVGIAGPGEPNAFFLQSGGKRYALLGADGIAVGSNTQSVRVGVPLVFTLIFEPLDDPRQPFDLIEGEHTPTANTTYWDVFGITLES